MLEQTKSKLLTQPPPPKKKKKNRKEGPTKIEILQNFNWSPPQDKTKVFESITTILEIQKVILLKCKGGGGMELGIKKSPLSPPRNTKKRKCSILNTPWDTR